MRRRMMCVPMMILCLLLAACSRSGEGQGSSAEELALSLRTEYIGMSACAGTLEITADYGERVYQYGMDLGWSKEEGMTLTVTAPENVAGVTIRIQAGETTLEFDGARIETGTITSNGLSPVDAPAALLKCMQEGYIASCGMETLGERESLRLECRDPDVPPGTGVEMTLWLDVETHGLLRGEISNDGVTVIQCSFSNFQLK